MNDMKLFNVPSELISRNNKSENDLPSYRTEFMRDRDRILYATAFRRLAGKTQIYTVGLDDHRRNRLTHTLEVSQIARTVSYALGLNQDLAEAIALAHDFGHTPFGHAGETMLNEIMIPNSQYVKNSPYYETNPEDIIQRFSIENVYDSNYYNYAYGFKHNLQSARVCAVLEDSYRNKKGKNIGLNLTNFTLYGTLIHSKLKYDKNPNYLNFQIEFENLLFMKGSDKYAWSFEAYIVAICDEIAQWHHDLEDAMRGHAIPINKICDVILSVLKNYLEKTDEEKIEKICENEKMDRKTIAELSHIVVNTLVNTLITTAKDNFNVLSAELKEKGINNSIELFKKYDSLGLSIKKEKIIGLPSAIMTDEFASIVHGAVHYSRIVVRMNEKGRYIIRKLFEAYYSHPQQLPDGPILHFLVETGEYESIDRVKGVGIGEARCRFEKIMENPNIHMKCVLMRRICDHISSMTDRYAIDEYKNLYG